MPEELGQLLGRINPVAGRLEGAIWENSLASLPPRLTYDIVVGAAPVAAGAISARPELTLERLALDGGSWRRLAGREYTFPRPHSVVVQDGEEYQVGGTGWLTFGDRSYWVKPLALAFGEASEQAIEATLRVLVTPSSMPEEREADGRELSLETRLEVGPVTVLGNLEGLEALTLDEAAALAERLLERDDYDPPVREGDDIRIHPRPGPPRSAQRAG
jgi:hypothetical protein